MVSIQQKELDLAVDVPHYNASVDLCLTPLSIKHCDEESNLKSPSRSSSCLENDASNLHNQHNGHQQMVSPRPQRDFYRFPVKVHRAAYKYEVCDISIVRAAYDLESESVTELPHGTVVSVEEIWSNRARISSPLCGWMSVYSSRGQQLLMPLGADAAKIGGQIMFQDEHQNIAYAEVKGYDHHCGLHSVMLERAGLQWVNLNDPNLRFIPNKKSQPGQNFDSNSPKQMREAFVDAHISISPSPCGFSISST